MSSHANLGVVIGHDGNRLYGFDAELFLKMENKRDRVWERAVMEWVQLCIEEPLADLDDVWASCKSGVVLCKLINVLKPNTIKKYSIVKLSALVERDNIDLFLQACWKFGIPASDMFNSGDLHSRKAITQVYQCLFALSQAAPSLGWKGPTVRPLVAAERKAPPAKKFETVAAGPKTTHADALVAGDSAQSALLDLQLKNAELDSEFKALKAEKYNKDQEITQLRKDVKLLQEKIKAGGSAPAAAASVAPVSSDGLPDEEQALQIIVLEREAELFKLKNADLQRKIEDLTKQRDAATNAEVAELKRRLGTLSKDNADLRVKVECFQRAEKERETNSSGILKPAESPRNSQSVSIEKRMSIDIPLNTRLSSTSVSSNNWRNQSSEEVRDGFHSNVSANIMASVEGLLTNILAGTSVEVGNVMKVGNLLPTESGRRAFSYVLDNVLEKVAFIQHQTAAVASLGFDLIKYGRRGKPHSRKLRVFAKTGIVDWGTDHVDLRNVVAIEKGKTTKVFSEFAAVDESKCMSLILDDRTLDIEAPSRLERDNFYWACMTVWDVFNLEKIGLYVSPLVLPEEHFQHVVYLCNQAIEEFQLGFPGSRNIDVMALALIMGAAERICTRSKQRVDGKYKFVQELVRHHFRELPASFWEEAFWRQQTKLLRERSEDQNDIMDESAEENEVWIAEQLCSWSRSLWAWGLDSFHVKEVMKLMHGSNKLQDTTLFELLKYVDGMEQWKKLGPKNLEREGIKFTQHLVKQMSKPLRKGSRKTLPMAPAPEKLVVEGYGGVILGTLEEEEEQLGQLPEGNNENEGISSRRVSLGSVSRKSSLDSKQPPATPKSAVAPLQKVEEKPEGREKSETVSSPRADPKVDPKAEAKRLKKEKEQAEQDAKLYSKRKQEEAKEKIKREEEKAKQDKIDAAKKAKEEAAKKKEESKTTKKIIKPSEKPKNIQLLNDLKDGILVDGCTRDTKEQALPDDLFEELFAMTKKDFAVLPGWQKLELRKKSGLF